jgi:DNA ligase-1
MENITEICNKFSTLKTKTKVQDKLDTLDEYASDSDFCFLLEYLLNEDKITGIKKSKLKKDIKKKDKLKQQNYDSIKDLINYLLIHNTGSDQDVYITQGFLNKIENINERQIISDLITKDFKCGVTDLTAYGHIPGLERNWRERKGHSLVDAKTGELKIKKILDKNITVTLKLDGYRYKIIKQNDKISIRSSSGKETLGLTEIIEEAKSLPDGVYDGEMIASGNFKDSTARFNATTKILGTDGEKIGVDFICFDYIKNVEAFLNFEEIELARYKRLNMLKVMLGVRDLKHIQLVPVYLNNEKATEQTINKIYEIYESKIGEGEEGLIVDLSDSSYVRAKGTSMFKLKPEVTGDFKVVGLTEGEGKDKGRLGAFIIEYKNNTVNVGSGLTDEIREQVWANQDFYINKLIEVTYFGETQDEKTELYSLRLPRFKRFRHDKNDISYD